MYGKELVSLYFTLLVDGLAGHVEHTAHDGFADGHRNGSARIGNFHAALETFGAAHGDGANPVVAEMLLRLERQLDLGLCTGRGEFDGERVVDARQFVRELDVHDRTNDLND